MMIKILALSVGVAMLSGAGIAQAADMAQTNTKSKAALAPVVDEPTPKTADFQSRGPLALTDTQMGKITAGHLNGPATLDGHFGTHWIKSGIDSWGNPTYKKGWGYHYNCGAIYCGH